MGDESFGRLMRRHRKTLDLTQAALAQLIPCATDTIKKLEQGLRRPSRELATLLAERLALAGDERAIFLERARATLDVFPGNLPASLTELIGRTQEIAGIGAQLRNGARLITLLGPGGTGKTRLALQGAAECAEGFADGAWFVDLAPISDPALVAAAVAQALGIPDSREAPTRDQLLRWLTPKRLLLLLDNFEQVVEAAPLVADILRAAPGVQVIVTSRVPLRISGEHEVLVAPLAVPETMSLPLAQLTQYDAVRLFIARTSAVQAAFQLTNANAPAVVAICARLDGLPLAIELAATRVRLFAPEQLLARLDAARFQTLVGGGRDMPARQQTIRAAIDWSYRLLPPAEQQLLARLGVFVGGWTLEAAEAVCGDEQMDVVAGLDALLQHSLVRREEPDGVPRFSLLETIRAYALEHLDEQGEGTRLARRHAEYFVALGETAYPKIRSAEQLEWLALLDREYDNVRAALVWALDYEQADDGRQWLGLELTAHLGQYWRLRGRFAEWRHWRGAADSHVQRLVGVPVDDERAAAHAPEFAPHEAAILARCIGEQIELRWWERQDDFDPSINQTVYALVQCSEDPDLLHRFRWLWSTPEEMLVLAREVGYQRGISHILLDLAVEAHERDDDVEAQRLSEEGLRIAETVGDRALLERLLRETGALLIECGEALAGKACFERSRDLSQALGYCLGIAFALHGLQLVDRVVGNYEAHRQHNEERLHIERELDNPAGIAGSLGALAIGACEVGNLVRAIALHREALSLLSRLSKDDGALQVCHYVLTLLEGCHLNTAAAAIAEHHELLHSHNYGLLCNAALDFVRGDVKRAAEQYQQLLAQYHQWLKYIRTEQTRTLTARGLEHGTMLALARCAVLRQDLSEAHARLSWLLIPKHARQLSVYKQAEVYLTLAWTHAVSGDSSSAHAALAEALTRFHRIGARLGVARSLECAAALAAGQGAQSDAARLWGAAEVLREQLGAPLWPVEGPEYERRVAEARAALDAEVFDAAWRAGRAMDAEQAVRRALAGCETVPQK